jgi:hypothetical protein
MNLKEFNKAYSYKYDPKGYDQWLIPKVINGKILDDCDGYSLGVLYYVCCNQSFFRFWLSLITRKAKMCRVITKGGEGHVVLRWEKQYIDNWSKEFVSKKAMEDLGHSFQFLLYVPCVIAAKMLYTQYKVSQRFY